jgi:hypothetical protein
VDYVEIRDRTERGVLAIDLKDVLRAAIDVGPSLLWDLRDLEATGDITAVWPNGMLDLERRVAEPNGLRIAWEVLLALAEHIEQTINCDLIGSGAFNGVDLLLEIEAIDSESWRVSCSDSHLLSKIAGKFRDVTSLQNGR